MWRALEGVTRYVVTPRVSKHRLLVWLDTRVCPDSTTIAIARDDDVTFGILHSRFHEAWALRLGTWFGKGNDPRYTPTTASKCSSWTAARSCWSVRWWTNRPGRHRLVAISFSKRSVIGPQTQAWATSSTVSWTWRKRRV